jgi:hypothetical protein
VVDPGRAKSGERIRISVKECVVLDDELSGSQMPPHIRIRYVARRHTEKPQGKDGNEHTPGLEQSNHACKDTLRFLLQLSSRRKIVPNYGD